MKLMNLKIVPYNLFFVLCMFVFLDGSNIYSWQSILRFSFESFLSETPMYEQSDRVQYKRGFLSHDYESVAPLYSCIIV